MVRNFRFKRFCSILILASITAVGLGIIYFAQPPQPANPIALTFLGYTNKGVKRVYLFEISNRLSRDVLWSFHSDGTNLLGQPMNFTIGVLSLGGGYPASSYGGSSLNAHTSLRFAASGELRSGEMVWFEFVPQPNEGDSWRYRLGDFLYRLGWRRGGAFIRPHLGSTRVNGPVMP